MSTLELKGSRKTGHVSLCRRHHDLGGTDYEYVGSLPDESADALRRGGSIRVHLREEAGPDQAHWVLDVIHEERTLPGTLLSDDRLDVLTFERDRIPVEIEEAELAFRKRALMRAQAELSQAEDLVGSLKNKIIEISREILTMTSQTTIEQLVTADGKYELTWTPEGPGHVRRHGEPWRDLGPGSLPLLLAAELKNLRAQISEAGGDPMIPGEPPAHYGPQRDMLRLTLQDGAELVQDAQGRVSATMGNITLSGLTGDKLTLSLAYEIEGARAALSALAPDIAHTATSAEADPDDMPGL